MFRILSALFFVFSSISMAAAQNCTTDGNRLGGLQTSIIQALNTGKQDGHHYMIYGRYNPLRANLVKEGFGMIMGTGHRDFKDCDEASFWVAINQVVLPTEENRQKYAKELVNDPSIPYMPPPQGPSQPVKGKHCFIQRNDVNPGGTCKLWPAGTEQDVGTMCTCGTIQGIGRVVQ